MSKQYHVYIITNKAHTVLYIGMTNNIIRRIWEHKNKLADGFTKKYNCTKLVYVETYDDVRYAIEREKNIKAWKRDWKNQMIEKLNPDWQDLYETII